MVREVRVVCCFVVAQQVPVREPVGGVVYRVLRHSARSKGGNWYGKCGLCAVSSLRNRFPCGNLLAAINGRDSSNSILTPAAINGRDSSGSHPTPAAINGRDSHDSHPTPAAINGRGHITHAQKVRNGTGSASCVLFRRCATGSRVGTCWRRGLSCFATFRTLKRRELVREVRVVCGFVVAQQVPVWEPVGGH